MKNINLYKGLWFGVLLVVIGIFSTIVSADDEQFTSELPLPIKNHGIVQEENNDSFDEVLPVEFPVIKEKKRGSSHTRSVTLSDGSVTYVTNSHAVQHDSVVFKWNKETFGTFITKFNDNSYILYVIDGYGINIKEVQE